MIESKEAALRILASLDRKLQLKGRKDKLGFIILGGTALLILKDHRVTEDIDVIILDVLEKEEVELLREHQINNRVEGILGFPPKEDFINNMYKLNMPFECIEVFIPDPVYLVLSKMFASRMYNKDKEDIINSGILEDIDFSKLEELYNEYRSYNSSPNYWRIEEIKEEYYKKKWI